MHILRYVQQIMAECGLRMLRTENKLFAAHDERAWLVRARDVEQMMGKYGW